MRRKLFAKVILEVMDLNYIYTNKLVDFLSKIDTFLIKELAFDMLALKTNINVYWYRLNKPSVMGL